PYRLPLLLAVVPSAAYLMKNEQPQVRAFAWMWLLASVAVLPSFIAYFKVNGQWNNLTVVDFWMALVIVPVLWHLCAKPNVGWLAGALLALTWYPPFQRRCHRPRFSM